MVWEVKGFLKTWLEGSSKIFKTKELLLEPEFLFGNRCNLAELTKHAPYIISPLKNKFPFSNFGELSAAFKLLPSEAIDTAIMEKVPWFEW